MRALGYTLLPILALFSLHIRGDELRQVQIRVEPAQPMSAVTLAAGGTIVSVPVKNGKALVPAGLPMPWTVAMSRFESAPFTADDLRQGRPVIVRELGVITGRVIEGGRPLTRTFSLLLKRNLASTVDERTVNDTGPRGGAFEARLPAGTYSMAINAETCATRVRPGVVIRPGSVTEVSEVPCDRTSPVLFRVVDARTKSPVSGAKVLWDPPPIFNADDSRVLFSRHWSTITDKRGVAALRVGPYPIPVRWRVEAAGYAVERSATSQLHEQATATLRDVALRPKIVLHVRVHLPEEAAVFRSGYLIVGELEDEHSTRYREQQRYPLRDDIAIEMNSYGDRRFSLADRNGRVLFYQNVTVDPANTFLDLSPRPTEIRGRVTQAGGESVAAAAVINTDPQNARVLLAQATTESDGSYSMKTWQRGELLVYVVPPSQPGQESGGALKRVLATGDPSYEVNFEIGGGTASVTVLDAATSAPVQARVAARVKDQGTGGLRLLHTATDENGKLILNGWPDGEAQLDISAVGHRAAQVTIPIGADQAEQTVRLEKSHGISGRVVDARGLPVSHAEISAGYDEEMGLLAQFETVTDADGQFHFDSPPDPGTFFYVVAPGYALGIETLDDTRENLITLPDLGKTIAYLTVNNAPPAKIYRVVVAPRGESLIPIGVLHDLGEANGMQEYQLLGSHHDGSVVLPEFLAPGAYDFFITRHVGKTLVYDRAGSLILPLSRPTVLNIKVSD